MKQLHKLLVLNIIILILALMPVEINAANDLKWSKTSELKFNSIAYGNGIYVAVGPNGLVQTTEDGDKWKLSEAVVSASLNSVIYTGKEFIAVGDDGAIISSDNGSLWKRLISGTRTSLRDVAKKGSSYVVVGDKGTILLSKDATNWNSFESGTNSSIKGVTANDNLFIAVGCDSKIISSVDGMHWSNSANIINNQTDLIIEDINWSNNSFNAVGYTKDNVFPVVLNSSDGQSWFVEVLYSLSQVDLSNTKLYNITSDGTQNIVIGSQGCVLTLPECHKCRKYKSISKDDLKGIALNSNLIVSVGTMGVYVSPIDATIHLPPPGYPPLDQRPYRQDCARFR
jgi:photosystem II stability/assembly factor-like uncharacterized protein